MQKLVTSLCAILVLALAGSGVMAQTTITIDGDLSDWTEAMRIDVPPARPIITWHDGASGRDNSPADPNDLDYHVDLNFAALYATDDADYLYLRIDMNDRADVRRLLNAEVYQNARIEVYFSTDPDLFEDFRDFTGMTWGWYYNGYDFIARAFPFDEAYKDTTGFQNPITEHRQFDAEGAPITGYNYAIYSRRPDLGVKIAWNAEFNSAEMAIPKSVLLQPQNLPDYEINDHVAIMLMSGAVNNRSDPVNLWWSQRIAANDNILGYIHTYEAEWSGEDPVGTSVEDGLQIPGSIVLHQNYPNPFNPSTTISFELATSQQARVEVYDVLGRSVAVLQDGVLAKGMHQVTFNAMNLPSGIYVYRLATPTQSVVRSMMLVK
jgi:hypothetical protein